MELTPLVFTIQNGLIHVPLIALISFLIAQIFAMSSEIAKFPTSTFVDGWAQSMEFYREQNLCVSPMKQGGLILNRPQGEYSSREGRDRFISETT